MQDEQQHQELARVSSDSLPTVITHVATLSLLAGGCAIVYAFVGKAPWLISMGVYGVVASPFLYGFSDMVRSLRSIARNSLGSRPPERLAQDHALPTTPSPRPAI